MQQDPRLIFVYKTNNGMQILVKENALPHEVKITFVVQTQHTFDKQVAYLFSNGCLEKEQYKWLECQ